MLSLKKRTIWQKIAGRRRMCGFLFLLVFSGALQAQNDTFYVDPDAGNDSNNGKSPALPFKTYSARTFAAGNVILFKRGCVIRDMLYTRNGSTAGYITYGAYGTGNKPVFLGSVALNTASNWTLQSGNVWRYSVACSTAPCNLIFNQGASCGNMRWAMADLDQQGEWYCDSTRRVYLYSTQNPALAYSSIECAVYGQRKMAGGTQYIRLQDLVFRNGGVHGYQDVSPHHIIIRNCEFRFIGGGVFDAITRVRFGNGIECWDGCHDILVEGCIFDNIYDSGVTHQGSNTVTSYNVYYRDNVFSNFGMAAYEYRGPAARDVFFENNTCLYAGGGFSLQGLTPPRMSEIYPRPMGHHVFIWLIDSLTQTGKVYIRNNIFYQASLGAAIYAIYDKTTDISPRVMSNIVIDHNCYYQQAPADTLLIRMNGKSYSVAQFALYKSECRHDSSSFVANPGFADLAGGDFHLVSTSPCIDTGFFSSDTLLYRGRRVFSGKSPDLGAFEYISTPVSLPPGKRVDDGFSLSRGVTLADVNGDAVLSFLLPSRDRVSVFVSDLKGRTVFQRALAGPLGSRVDLNLGSLPEGMYSVRVTGPGNRVLAMRRMMALR